MKAKRVLAGLMSLVMMCSVVSTPAYALEEGNLPAAPAQSEPAPETTPEAEATPVPEATPAPEATPVPEETPAPEATPVPEETPAPEATPVPEETPVPEATPVPEVTENTVNSAPANRSLAPANAARSGSFAEVAESYYGDDSSPDYLHVNTISARWGSAMAGATTAKAGQSLTVVLDWTLTAAATYSYTTHPEPMFENYEDSVIRIQLPEHVTIRNPEETADKLPGVQSIQQTDADNNIWEISLDKELPSKSASSGSVALPLFIQGNGQLPLGTVLSFLNGNIQFETHFTILDRSTSTPQKTEYTYSQTATTVWPGDITLTSDDKWILDKQPQGSPVVDAGAGTVTMQFTLEYGLHNLANEGGENDANEINRNPGSYGREGRIPFAGTVQLTELPTVLDHGDIQPVKITVTPEFGSQEPISVTSGTPVDLPVDVCGNHSDAITGTVSAEAPYRSTYQVTVVYDYDDFVTSYRDPDNGPRTIHNEATVAYTLAGDTLRTTTDSAEQQVQVVTEPATLQVTKAMVLADGSTRPYSADNYQNDSVRGPATFTVTGEGDQPATLYTRNGDGSYTALKDNVLTIDPAQGSDGTVTVYLDPGSYTVTETVQPQNSRRITAAENAEHNAEPKTLTLEAGKTGTAAFYNKELLGSILVNKQDESNHPLAGATIALYDVDPDTNPDADPLRTQTSMENGRVLFDRLPFGTYYIQETGAPADYELSPAKLTVTISEANPNHTNSIIHNYKNSVTVTLQKYMSDGRGYQQVGDDNYQEFAGAFRLQKEVAKDTWEDVTKTGDDKPYTYDLNRRGQISLMLPAHDEEGNVIQYRFLETLPAGWHDPKDPNATEMEIRFTLVGDDGNPTNKIVDAYNDRNGSFTLTKEFYRASTSGYSKEADGHYEATFALYYKTEESNVATLYSDNSGINYGSLTTQNGKLTVLNLPRTYTAADQTIKGYTYYLVETGTTAKGENPAVSWVLDGETQTFQTAAGQKKACEVFDFVPHGDDKAQLDQSFTVKNYENKVGVLVKKEDSITGDFVEGCTFTVTTADGTVVQASTDIAKDGTFVALEPGKIYTIAEASWPEGYTPKADAREFKVDLTQLKPGADTKTITFTLKNHPDPKLNITKTLQPGGNTLDQTFEVWREETNGNLTDTGKTLTAGTALQLPAGTYYLKEKVDADNPHNILDPNDGYASLYTDQGKTVGGIFYFGPFTLTEVEDSDDLVQEDDVTNYVNLGSVTVQKNGASTDGKVSPLRGAVLGIYDANGKPITDSKGQAITATTDGNGKATFQNLPVYDENKAKITYTIREITPPTGYTLLEDALEVKLDAGKTVTTDVKGEDLTLLNLPTMKFQVKKVYRHLWEYHFTNKDYLLPGTRIALFEQTDGNFHFVDLKTTGELGTVTFEGLSQTKTYYAVEFSIPDGDAYSFLVPYNDSAKEDKDYLSDLVPGYETMTDEQIKDKLETITLNDGKADADSLYNIHNFNYVVKQGTNPTQGEDGKVTGVTAQAEGTLINAEHWTQLNIFKYKMSDTDNDGDKEKVPVDNATFELYQQILPDNIDETAGDDGNISLTFHNDQKDTLYTYVGRYSSGTLYTADGTRRPGWFGTDILEGGSHVVYWLVEISSGTGAAIMPENQVILVKPSGSKYVNNSIAMEDNTTSCTQEFEYSKDAVTTHEVENKEIKGPGDAQFALVRIAKWAGSYDAQGGRLETYDPLGNATFDLYLVDQHGNPVHKLDTLTTGLDNGNFDGGTKTAWASSSAISFAELGRMVYGEDWEEKLSDNSGKQDVLWEDAQGNRYARVALVETSAPAGYSTPDHGYRMLLFFRATSDTEQSTTTYNDAFYLKEHTGGDLAESMKDTDWAFYPTREDGQSYTPIKVEGQTSHQYRVVNWPVDNFAVTVTKYGYTVSNDNLNMTADQLDDYYLDPKHPDRLADRQTLSGVEMQLQRLVGQKWENIDYPVREGSPNSDNNGRFTTGPDGSFAFPDGLMVGSYRIYEVKGNTEYQNIYPDANHAYYFQVTNENLAIHLYNPRYFSVTVKKTNMGGEPLENAAFTLTRGSSKLDDTTDSNGNATFTLKASGVYSLSETAPENYTANYLQAYLAATYSGDSNTYTRGQQTYPLRQIAGNGIYLGFETEVVKDQADNPVDVKVTNKVDLSDYGLTGNNLALAIPNPSLGSLTLTKQDTLGRPIEVTGNEKPAVFSVGYKAFTAWSDEQTFTDDDQWTVTEHTLGTNGTLSLNKLQPGVYKIWENTAPTGYLTDSTPQYVVITGGMNVTVTIKDSQGNNLSISETDPTNLTFQDKRLLDLKLEKTIDDGDVPFTGTQTFTFVLTKADGTPVGTQDVKVGAAGTGEATFTDALEPGQEYILTEQEATGFAWTYCSGGTITDNAVRFTANADDRTNMTFSVTNTYLKGRIQIRKVDGKNGTPLPGAVFTVYKADKTTEVGTMTDHKDGSYTLDVDLDSTEGQTFVVKETRAPKDYVTTGQEVKVTVKPGQIAGCTTTYQEVVGGLTAGQNKDQALLDAGIFPNYKGAIIKLTKYNNVKDSVSKTPVSKEVTFQLYRQQNGLWVEAGSAATDANGELTFTVDPDEVYALVETLPQEYYALEGIWQTEPDAMQLQKDGNYYILNGGAKLAIGTTYELDAYNVPYVPVELRKQDALHPEAEKQPTAIMKVYGLPDGTTSLTEKEIEGYMQGTPLTEQNVTTQAGEGTNRYTAATVKDIFAVGKTYLVVESESSYSQIRDHNSVVWYAIYKVPADANGTRSVTLKNVEGNVSLKLDKKSTATTSYESLLSSEAKLEYVLTPTVENTYALDSFQLTDNGLTAYTVDKDGNDHELDFEDYLYNHYTITDIILKPSTQDGAAFNGGTQPNDLEATVTFTDFDGGEYIYGPYSAASEQHIYPDTDKKIKSMKVVYSSEKMAANGYALGQNFTPGTVTVRMTLDKQVGGPEVEAIDKVTNHAEAELTYRTWDKKGGQSQETTKLDDDADASDTFLELDAARVMVTKTADTQHTSLDQTVTYTVTLENLATATAPMQDPFLVDMLPQGTLLAGDAGNVKLTEAPEGMTLRSKNIATLNGENALFLYLDGDLQPGKKVVLTLQVQITNQVTRYGTDINNFVLAGSQVKGIQSVSNPQSSSFMTSDNAWPNNMDGVLTSMKPERVETLRTMLGDKNTFGYVSSKSTIHWSAATGASVVKTGMGNLSQEQGFSDSLLSTVSNNGWMDYQLQFSNRSADDVNFTNASLVDVFPSVGDAFYNHSDRSSEWGMHLDTTVPVKLFNLDEKTGNQTELTRDTDYRVFYYTGTVNANTIRAIYDQAVDLKFTTQTLPDSWWSTTATSEATAMVIAIKQDDAVALERQHAYLASYRLSVGKLEDDELAEYAWTNAVNNFVVDYSTYAANTDIQQARPAPLAMDSNSVANTIMPAQVKVGGHIWIDKNRNGIWEDGESATDPELNKLRLVQNLLNSVQIRLETFQGTGSTPTVTDFGKNTTAWQSDANFIFEGLDPASKQDGATEAQLYNGTAKNNPLNPAYLKGQSPKTYNITVTLPANSGVEATVTTLGGGDPDKDTGYSRHPDELKTNYKDESQDNNYLDNKGSAVSERFYLYSTPEDVFDNTKDIGYLLERTLTLHKVAANDDSKNLEGAEFEVYGPFDSVEDANAATTLDAGKLVASPVTDSDGKATVENLNWFQAYIIVEKDSADGYQLDGAEANANVAGLLTKYTGKATKNPAWVLGIPGDQVTQQDQLVTVTNRTEVEFALTAAKTLEGKALQDNQFTFALLDEDQKELFTAQNVSGVVTFPAIQKAETGTFVYYIQEKIPEAAQDLVYGDILYDDTLYRVTVKVDKDPDNDRLVADILYEVQQDGQWTTAPDGAVFTNLYLPAFHTTYQPKVNKTFAQDSDTIPGDAVFTFTLTPTEDYGTAVQIGEGLTQGKAQVGHAGGTADFDLLHFTRTGEYRFTIAEQNDKAEGFTYDATVWTLTVKVEQVDNDLTVTQATYTASGKEPAGWASFVNSYNPPDNPPDNPPETPTTNPPETPGQSPEPSPNPVIQWLRTLLPQTGDGSNPALWLVLFCISAVCLAGFAGVRIYRRRNTKK